MVRGIVKAKVLFLDFDGVLHTASAPYEGTGEFVWLPILKGLIAARPDVKLVVHASCRRTAPPERLRQRLGFGKEVLLGVTKPTLERWPSIQNWTRGRPWIESFRILDDQAFEFPQPAPSDLILCDGRLGLSEERVQIAMSDWLGVSPPTLN